jgi:hypothetical protein
MTFSNSNIPNGRYNITINGQYLNDQLKLQSTANINASVLWDISSTDTVGYRIKNVATGKSILSTSENVNILENYYAYVANDTSFRNVNKSIIIYSDDITNVLSLTNSTGKFGTADLTKDQVNWHLSPVEVFEEGYFYIQNVGSKKFIDIENRTQTAGAKAIGNSYDGDYNQYYQVKKSGAIYYQIIPMHVKGFALSAVKTATNRGEVTMEVASDTAGSQKWILTQVSNGKYSIQNVREQDFLHHEATTNNLYDLSIQQTNTNNHLWSFEIISLDDSTKYNDAIISSASKLSTAETNYTNISNLFNSVAKTSYADNPLESPTFSIYPNPTTDSFELDYELEDGQVVIANIVSTNGLQVKQLELTKRKTIVDISGLVSGHYVVILYDINKKLQISKHLIIDK